MAKIKLNLPLGEAVVTGKVVTFTAPCSCTETEAIHINGVDYTVVDALGKCVTGKYGRWEVGAVVSVILDTEKKFAFLQNGNLMADQVTVSAEVAERLGLSDATVDEALGVLKTLIDGAVKIETGSYTGTGNYGSSKPTSLTFSFTPKVVFIGSESSAYPAGPYVWGSKSFLVYNTSSASYKHTTTVSGNTMSWYSDGGNAGTQLDSSGSVYYYVAIG